MAKHSANLGTALAEVSFSIGRELLRVGRVRFDVAGMVMMRFWLETNLNSTYIYLFTDGSPQWRGVEMMGPSIDCIRSTPTSWWQRRFLLPIVQSGNGQLTLQGETYAIRWKIVLMVGQSYTAMRSFLSKVVSATSDLGTERLLD